MTQLSEAETANGNGEGDMDPVKEGAFIGKEGLGFHLLKRNHGNDLTLATDDLGIGFLTATRR